MSTYPEPKSHLANITAKTTGKPSSVVELTSGSGYSTEVSYLQDTAWCIEVRYDKSIKGQRQQIFTGAQELLKKDQLTPEVSGAYISISHGSESLSINTSTFSFELKGSGHTLLSSSPQAFTAHSAPVSLYEGIISRKVTDIAGRYVGFGPPVDSYRTRMVRFQYKRPTGLVLGLPGCTGEMNRNGYRFELYNTDTFVHTPARPPMYESWPILIHKAEQGDSWVGVFHDNPSRTFVDIGDFYPEQVTFESSWGNSRVYILTGNTLAELANKFSRLVGAPYMLPLWSYGYQQCRWSYMSSQEIREVVAELRKADIPCDAMYYDIDYMDGFRVFTTNENTFGDLKETIDELHAENIKSICIVDPGVKIDQHFSVYNELKPTGNFLKNEDGSPFVASVWPGDVLLPDFIKAETRDQWSDFQKDWLDSYPFDGIWNDMNEPANFNKHNLTTSLSITERGPFTHESNLYGYHMALASQEGCNKAYPDKRALVITRSGYPGVQKHSVIWHGDNQAWWEHLRLAIDTCVSYSICGAFYTGPDVPGFTGNPSDDLAVRFFQLGAFLPLYRGHSIYFAKDKEPYAFNESTKTLIRDAIRLRYSLLREWYSGFELATRTNSSPMMPVLSESGALVRDHFVLFDKLLVAPVIERDQEKKSVYLPEGDWYRLGNTEQTLSGNTWHLIDVTLKDVPVFVKAGSILVRNSIGKTSDETLSLPESYEVYADSQGKAKGYYYSDDGISVNAAKAERYELLVSGKGDGVKRVAITS
jgi:alpha-glucosidase